ncbi:MULTISPECIES: recombination protein NinB [unclassified Tatumella]|uniref:recombination protein NinB n=1 Tax=unclassified Tatumella TaxID=2649542 RepID=UPI001BAEE2A3|nr:MULTISPECIES: recombination protein NinB [unclassified Tatumella]MBS0857256.1 recombination protein NinB [Tatumella sp. JGM16]MBS0914009.1 recombination protein NinB [Tatumella sp. JGM91]
MDKKVFYLRDDRIKQNLKDFIDQLPTDDLRPLTVTIDDSKRTLPQNDLFHALCTDVSRQVLWQRQKLALIDWKALFVSGHAMATGRPGIITTGIEGEFCSIRESTAQMGVKRMTSLIEYSTAWAAGNGVRLRDVTYRGDYFGHMS